jgi:hypothetical protein
MRFFILLLIISLFQRVAANDPSYWEDMSSHSSSYLLNISLPESSVYSLEKNSPSFSIENASAVGLLCACYGMYQAAVQVKQQITKWWKDRKRCARCGHRLSCTKHSQGGVSPPSPVVSSSSSAIIQKSLVTKPLYVHPFTDEQLRSVIHDPQVTARMLKYAQRYQWYQEMAENIPELDDAACLRWRNRARAIDATYNNSYQMTEQHIAYDESTQQLFIAQASYSISFLTDCYGAPIQLHLHTEVMDIAQKTAAQWTTYAQCSLSVVPDYTHQMVNLIEVTHEYTQQGRVDYATWCADFCWSLLAIGTSFAHGVVDGAIAEIYYMATHPVHTALWIVAPEYMGAYALSKLVYHVACISIDHAFTAATADDPVATACSPLVSIYTALTESNLTLQEKLCKGAYAAGMLMAQAHTQQKVISTLSGWYQRTITVVEQYAQHYPMVLSSSSITVLSKPRGKNKEIIINEKQSSIVGKVCKNGSGRLIKKITSKEASEIAQQLGFEKTNYYSRGQRIFKKGNRFITLDVDQHSDGFWKMANSIENLKDKVTRMGTYDKFLNRIGD